MSAPVLRTMRDPLLAIQLRGLNRYGFIIKLVGSASIFTSPFWLGALFFTSPQDYSYASSLICVPLLTIIGTVAVIHFTQGDPYLRRLLMISLMAHMAASSMFLWLGLVVYGGTADAFHYWTVGRALADQFQTGGWSVFHPPYWSTNLINNVSGVAALLIGDALPTLFIAFALIPLAGTYCFYRAFVIVFPDGDRWLFGLLAALSPSLLFWSSFLGKDSPIQYFIALTCLGFAKVTHQAGLQGALLCAVGLSGTLLMRAHVAAILAIAMTLPYLIGKSRRGSGHKATKLILIPVLLLSTYFLISQAHAFLYSNTNSADSTSVFQEADTITKNSHTGGSAFNGGTSLPIRIAEAPVLMFRPFPWEIHNGLALVSAVESMGLLIFCLVQRREIWSMLRDWRNPYVGFLLMYSIVFSITFGATISNFGILARQRIMMTPIVIMLLCGRQRIMNRRSLQKLEEQLGPNRMSMFSSSSRLKAGVS